MFCPPVLKILPVAELIFYYFEMGAHAKAAVGAGCGKMLLKVICIF
jgi:hypothetical protein